MSKESMEYAVEILAETFWSYSSQKNADCDWAWYAKNNSEIADAFRKKAKSTIEKAHLLPKDEGIDFSFKDAFVSSK